MKYHSGFTYAISLFLVAILSVVALRAVENTSMRERRDMEAELLWVGAAYRNAIRSYYLNSPGSAKQYPPDLAALLLDDRATRISRPLRKLYADPISNTSSWGVIEAPSGGVMGVYSLSTKRPVKQGGFPVELASFNAPATYQDWKFLHQPN